MAKKAQNPYWKTKVKWAAFRKTINTSYSSLRKMPQFYKQVGELPKSDQFLRKC